jgi:hypothetical protein
MTWFVYYSTVIRTLIAFIAWVLICEKQMTMRCVEIVTSARGRMAPLNVPLDLTHSMFFLHFHDYYFTFQIQLVTSWWSNNILAHLFLPPPWEENQSYELGHVWTPMFSVLCLSIFHFTLFKELSKCNGCYVIQISVNGGKKRPLSIRYRVS